MFTALAAAVFVDPECILTDVEYDFHGITKLKRINSLEVCAQKCLDRREQGCTHLEYEPASRECGLKLAGFGTAKEGSQAVEMECAFPDLYPSPKE